VVLHSITAVNYIGLTPKQMSVVQLVVNTNTVLNLLNHVIKSNHIISL
jgi:hypothetical protein